MYTKALLIFCANIGSDGHTHVYSLIKYEGTNKNGPVNSDFYYLSQIPYSNISLFLCRNMLPLACVSVPLYCLNLDNTKGY